MLGWMTVLKAVPWTEVIRNAPAVADGAKKLWKTVAGKPDAPASGKEGYAVGATNQRPDAMDERMVPLEAAVADLHAQMLASSELIKALAEQNAQLIRHVEGNRRRLFCLGAAIILAAALALAALLLNNPQL